MPRAAKATLWTTIATIVIFAALTRFVFEELAADRSDTGGGAALGGLIIFIIIAVVCITLIALIFPFAAGTLAGLGQVGYGRFLAAIVVIDVAAALALSWAMDGWHVNFWAFCFGLLCVVTIPASALWWRIASSGTSEDRRGSR